MRIVVLRSLTGAVSALVIVAAVSLWNESRLMPRWLRCKPMIAHGLGAIGSNIVTNSKEAFESSYAKGFRTFEIDLSLTRDSAIAFVHDWTRFSGLPEDRGPLAVAEWDEQKLFGRWTPLTVSAFVRLMEEYDDAIVILDIKADYRTTINTLIAAIGKRKSEVLSRIVPQIYSPDELSIVRSAYPFPSVIFTLYRSSLSDQEVYAAAVSGHIAAVTMFTSRFSPDLAEALQGAHIAALVHTVNSPAEEALWRRRGATGVYTDSLPPGDAHCGA